MKNIKMAIELDFFRNKQLNKVYNGDIQKIIDEKIFKNRTNKKILDNLEENAIKNTDNIKIGGTKDKMVKRNKKIMKNVEEDLENHRLLRKHYKNLKSVKLSMKMKNIKMKIELSFLYNERLNDSDWYEDIFISFDIREPIEKF